MLENKNAIIYGAGGAIGAAVARAFAAQGATVHLTGRTRGPLDEVAAAITESGGHAEAAVVDALDEDAVRAHAQDVADRTGHLDISLNLITRGDVQGVPLTELPTADFLQPITTGVTTNFITARTAARLMAAQGSGVILTLNSGSAQGSPMMGGTGPADAAIDALVRNLAQEVGPSGVRVVGIWTAGLPETLSPEKLSRFGPRMDETAFKTLLARLDEMRMTRRSPTLAQVAATAAFLASDHAAAITGTFVNTSSGMFPG
ncbi:SDR family NAD(P)-dependent oxidoreductase [Actinomadura fibrosa]|uniref:SDR family NAD(P)-dependent oxidoreductase n=1 Tax=Actinomadura fibrosa TaxID=111802 RepID=A0ABW2XFG0_9ACTN|nr:SDR family oxidoreductase [Actinomadura fibrosa]